MGYDAWVSNWDATPEAAAERESEARAVEREQAEEEQFSPEAQMLDAIGDEVYRLVHESSELRAKLTADQRVTLNFTLWAVMNDKLLWAEHDEARRGAP
jgi:hypothetical protein